VEQWLGVRLMPSNDILYYVILYYVILCYVKLYYCNIILYYCSIMGPRLYTRSVVERNVVMRRIPVLTFHSPCWVLHATNRNICCTKSFTGIPLQVLTHCVTLRHKILHKIHFIFGPLIKLLRIYWRRVSAQLNLTRNYT